MIKQRGFTIVELLIVIVVIGILAGITIVAYSGIQSGAQASNAQSALQQATKKLALYLVDNSTYPTDTAAFNTLMGGAGGSGSSNTTYQYSVNNTTTPPTYCVTATSGTTSYKADSVSTQPANGGCSGHGVGGTAAVTNVALNPSFEVNQTNLGNMGAAGTVSTRTRVNDWADSGSWSSRVAKISTIDTAAGSKVSISNALADGDIVRWAVTIKNETSGVRVFRLFGERNSPTYAGLTSTYQSSGNVSIPANSIARVVGEITVNSSNAGPSGVFGFGVLPQSTYQIGESYVVDSFVITINEQLPTNYKDGASVGWIWNGTTDNSTSTGPPL